MHVLVTGATGSLGRVVVARLLAEGHQVSALSRRPFLAQAVMPPDVVLHEWHPISEPVPAAALAGVEAIVHLMGAPLADPRARDAVAVACASRVNAARRLAAAIEGRGLRLVATSIAAAPPGPGEPLSDVPTQAMGEKAGAAESPFAGNIEAWERAALEAGAQGASVAVVRLGLIAAPSASLGVLAALARHGMRPDLRSVIVPAITATDAAAMLAGLAQQRQLEGVIHGVAPEPVPGEALAQVLVELGRSRVRRIAPMRTATRRLGLLHPLLAARRRVVPERLLAAGARFETADPLAALAEALAREAAALERAGGPGLLDRMLRRS